MSVDSINEMKPDKQFSEAVELLKELIAIPSNSREEEAVANHLCERLSAWGVAYQRIGHNVLCGAQQIDSAKPTLLFCAHLDTVRPAQGWQRDPYTPVVEEGRLYGLGSNDDGAGLVCLLQTYRQLIGVPQPYNLLFLASTEEEVSGAGGFEKVRDALPPVSVAVVGEPTGMQPAVAEKGLMVLDVTEHGRAGHAARNEGINAIYLAMDDVQWIRNYQFPRVSPLLGVPKMTVTVINAGTQHNVIPDTCTMLVDVRSNELYTNQELYELICDHLHGEVQAHSFRLNSSHIDVNHPLVRRAVAMGRTPYGSPTLSDQALMPFPSLKLGPGQSSRSHTADEYVELSEMDEALKLYPALLNGLEI